MLNYRQGDFKSGHANIHYYRTGGNKPPFVLLHGATDNGLCWTRTAEMLAGEYDVIMPDAQGHGLSDRLGPDFTFEDHIDEVAALIRGLGLERPVTMGHSMGAGTAAGVAVKYPDLPAAIILEDPPWDMPQAGSTSEEARKQSEAFRSFLTGLRKLTLEEIVRESRKRDPGWAEEERLPWARAKQQFDPSLFARPVINPRPYTAIVPEIRCPTLLICAENGIVSADVAENAARLWRSENPFRWVRIKGAGHNIRRERFEEFYAAATGFLEEISA